MFWTNAAHPRYYFDVVGKLEVFLCYARCCYSACLSLSVSNHIACHVTEAQGVPIVSLALLLPPPLLALTPYFSR